MESGSGALHPPKVETFDVAAMTNTDPKGIVRAVATYRVEPYGLYLARPVPDHPTVVSLRSWLLPEMGLRVTSYAFRPGRAPDWDRYLDTVTVSVGSGPYGPIWRTSDLYLDLVVRTGAWVRVLDADEFLEAVRDRLLDAGTAEPALAATHRAVDGIASHGYDVDAWLGGLGLDLTWPA